MKVIRRSYTVRFGRWQKKHTFERAFSYSISGNFYTQCQWEWPFSRSCWIET